MRINSPHIIIILFLHVAVAVAVIMHANAVLRHIIFVKCPPEPVTYFVIHNKIMLLFSIHCVALFCLPSLFFLLFIFCLLKSKFCFRFFFNKFLFRYISFQLIFIRFYFHHKIIAR